MKGVADLIGPEVRLLLVGVNPGIRTAETGVHFAHPSNRFYPVLHAAGLTSYRIVASTATVTADREHLVSRGVGITNLVARATRRADELDAAELAAGVERLANVVERHRPRVVALTGITAFRTAFGRSNAQLGPQADGLGGAELWALPNTSGLNARASVDELAHWYRAAGVAAGVIDSAPTR